MSIMLELGRVRSSGDAQNCVEILAYRLVFPLIKFRFSLTFTRVSITLPLPNNLLRMKVNENVLEFLISLYEDPDCLSTLPEENLRCYQRRKKCAVKSLLKTRFVYLNNLKIQNLLGYFLSPGISKTHWRRNHGG